MEAAHALTESSQQLRAAAFQLTCALAKQEQRERISELNQQIVPAVTQAQIDSQSELATQQAAKAAQDNNTRIILQNLLLNL